ncbi:DEAD/DEAH box helicase [Desulfoplanes sp. PS50]
MNVTLDSCIRLEKCPTPLMREITRSLEIRNPKFDEAVRCGRWTGGIDEVLECYSFDSEGRLCLPRGFGLDFHRLALKQGVQPHYTDNRRLLDPVEYQFKGVLRDYQQEAVDDALKTRSGIVTGPTGMGKTVLGLAMIAERRQPTMVLVSSLELMHQWADRIEQFLGIKAGMAGGGKYDVRDVTVGVVNSVLKHLDELTPRFGHVICDESHRTPCRTFTDCLSRFDAMFVLGLSATPARRDKLEPLMFWGIGPLVHSVDADRLRDSGKVLRPEIITRKTGFQYSGNIANEYAQAITALCEDQHRNELIVHDVVKEAQRGAGTVLLVSDRVDHLERLKSLVEAQGQDVRLLTGKTPKRERAQIVSDLTGGKVKVLASTTSLIGEGFDAPGLATLVLACPIKWSGRLIQTVGRVLRPSPGKRARVIDFVDELEPVLLASFKARQRVYREIAA